MTAVQDAAPIVRETLPVAAQWGILGILCLLLIVAVVYLALKLDSVRQHHAAELRAIAEAHAAEVRALLNARVKETGEYAQALAELLGPVQDVVEQVDEITKAMAERAKRRPSEKIQRVPEERR